MKMCRKCLRNIVTEPTYPYGGKFPVVPPWNFCPWCGEWIGDQREMQPLPKSHGNCGISP